MERVPLKQQRGELPIRLIRKKELAKMLGLSTWSVSRYLKHKRDFPRPLKFSDQVIVWDLAEIQAWLAKVQRV